ncbi:SET domain-containing protein SmydA-8-like [Tigriopus californicus]|uniref:SET domain-containing protein SmydA-8-like n=1 Tax=Tigriopus californicus TaxID=6832 RepID=UPI0027DAAB26|nr:SET domain-containing protein SmydA-8-like [Tigriopus californicus]
MKVGMDHQTKATPLDEEVKKYLIRDEHQGPSNEKRPYKIVYDDIVGRHMVAARDIKPGEIIFKESPITFGPTDATKPICLGCYKRIKSHGLTCDRCHFPMCSRQCQDIPEHAEYECQVFQERGFRVRSQEIKFDDETPIYGIVSVIRGLLLRKKHPEKWDLLWSHMSHHEKRKRSHYWRQKTNVIIDHVKAAMILEEKDVETLEIILGIFLVNTFEVSIEDRSVEVETAPEASIQALFGLASMPSHSCVANCTHDFSSRKSGYVMTMRSLTHINKGEDITHSYTEPFDPLLQRQALLQVGKFFSCQCPRCSDPTELGTYASALKCRKCGKGNVISSDVHEIEAKWVCENQDCPQEMGTIQIRNIYQAAKGQAESLDPSESNPSGATIPKFEAFIKKYANILHPNHVILTDRKYVLAKMYGRMTGYEAHQLTDEQFKRKRDLCREVLQVLDQIMPGRTRKRGMMMYELHLPLVMLANRALERGPNPGTDPKEIKKNLKDGLSYLRKGLEILSDEPAGTFEQKIVEGSKESLVQLEQWVTTVCTNLK